MLATPTSRFNHWIRQYRWPLLTALILSLPVVIWGAQQAWDSNANRVEDWLPETFEETELLWWFFHRFGRDELLMISWEGCTLDDERLAVLREKLIVPVSRNGRAEVLFDEVLTGPQVLQELTEGRLGLPRQQALQRLQGWLVGADGQTTCAVAVVSMLGAEDRHGAVDYAFQAVEAVTGLSADQIHLAGPTLEGVAIDRASQQSLLELNVWSFLLCFLIMVVCLRSLRVAVLVSSVALFNLLMSMALIHYTGTQMDSILLMTANLAFVLSISAGIHLVNYYRDRLSHHGLNGAPGRAFADGWVPCVLGAVTTAVGLGSLTVSQVIPITRFGIYSAAAVLLATGILLFTLPALLSLWPAREWLEPKPNASDPDFSGADGGANSVGAARLLDGMASLVARAPSILVVLATVLLCTAGWGVTRLRTSVGLHNMFTSEARVLRDYAWLEQHIGPLVPVEVVVTIPQSAAWCSLERLRFVERVRSEVQEVGGIGATISAAAFAPSTAGTVGSSIRHITRATVFRRLFEENRHRLVDARFLFETEQEQSWRISARVAAGEDHDYGDLLAQLSARVRPLLEAGSQETGEEIHGRFLGAIPLVHKTQDQLLIDLLRSFGAAFGLIAVALMLLLRSPTAGLLSMLPNMLPSVVVFGAVG